MHCSLDLNLSISVLPTFDHVPRNIHKNRIHLDQPFLEDFVMANVDPSAVILEAAEVAEDESIIMGIDLAKLAEDAFERIIKSQRDFCLFLRDLFVPEKAVQTPPEQGWSEITNKSFAALGKSDRVISVLRHLTYIADPKGWITYEFQPETSLYDYRHPYNASEIAKGNVEDLKMMSEGYENEATEDMIGLTVGGLGTRTLLLDCRYGLVYWDDGDEGKPVEVFLDDIKTDFKEMRLLPIDQGAVSNDAYFVDKSMEKFRDVYRKHGWPEKFDKEACAAEVIELYESL